MDLRKAKAFILDKLKQELPADLTYHGLHHTLDVYKTTLEYARLEHVTGEELTLLRTAALFHDAGFTATYRGHEKAGCTIARQELPRFGYNEVQIDRICGMIMATQLPQSPHNLLEEIICDCDLDYLGRTDFYHIGSTLYHEFMAYGVIHSEEDWNRLQVSFLGAHRYFTKTGNLLRKPLKTQHLQEVEKIVAGYQKLAEK